MAASFLKGLALPLEQALTQRMKELHYLQQIKRIISSNQGTINDMLAEIVTTIPAAWLHPASTIARIRRGDHLYQTGDLEHCQSVQSSQIRVNDRVYGAVDACLRVFREKGYRCTCADA